MQTAQLLLQDWGVARAAVAAHPASASAAAAQRVIVVSGAVAQPSVNGVYTESAQVLHGHRCFAGGMAGQRRLMYWTPSDGGHWVIAESAQSSFRAIEPDASTPQSGPGLATSWDRGSGGRSFP